MKILAIDTSCDETSVAICEDGRLLSNIYFSQIDLHKKWGGVVPIIARRNHEERIDQVIEKALKLAQQKIENIDYFAVTYGPGLAVALEVGIRKVKELAKTNGKKLIAVNHMAGHTYANFALNKNGQSYGIPNKQIQNIFPLITLLISGGHTELVYMKSHLNFEIIGKTLDDSVGEAFDKIARMLSWGYPGGPIIEEFAKLGDEKRFDLPVSMVQSGDLNFSYSGLKTAVMRLIAKIGHEGMSNFDKAQSNHTDVDDLPQKDDMRNDKYLPTLSHKPTFVLSKVDSIDLAASFQRVACEQLLIKVRDALRIYPVQTVILGGGVVNNLYIRKKLRALLREEGVDLFYPRNKKLLTDNAGMIASAAYYMALNNQFADIEALDRSPNLKLS